MNGKSVEKTQTVTYKDPLLFNDSFIFECDIPRGFDVDNCNIMLDVLEIDSKTNSSNAFYRLQLTGKELSELLSENSNKVLQLSHIKYPSLISEIELKLLHGAVDKDKLEIENLLDDITIEVAEVIESLFNKVDLQIVDVEFNSNDPSILNDTLDLIIVWNAVEVKKFPAKFNKNKFEWISEFDKKSVYPKLGLSISDKFNIEECLLEIHIWSSRNSRSIGSVLLFGDSLLKLFSDSHCFVKVNELFQIKFTGNLIVSTGDHLINEPNGLKNHSKNFEIITTDLSDDVVGWSLYFNRIKKEDAILEKESDSVRKVDDKMKYYMNITYRDYIAMIIKLMRKMKLELAEINFTATSKQIIDEHRASWRGRVMPKNFMSIGSAVKTSVMQSRYHYDIFYCIFFPIQ